MSADAVPQKQVTIGDLQLGAFENTQNLHNIVKELVNYCNKLNNEVQVGNLEIARLKGLLNPVKKTPKT